MFPDGEKDGLYHTADATLWFFHALDRYLKKSDDQTRCTLLLPTLVDIVEHHLRGTKFNIHVDPADGLLVQGEEGYQLTWMDAKMGDWVVTPRRGKAVEINALWYNALALLSQWLRQMGSADAAQRLRANMRNARAFHSTNASGSPTADIFTMWSIATSNRERTILLSAQPDFRRLARSSCSR